MAHRSFLQGLMQMLGGASAPDPELAPSTRRQEDIEAVCNGRVAVSGARFGHSDCARLESCVVEARERCTAGQYFEQEIAAIERNFQTVKTLLLDQQHDGGRGRDGFSDDERLRGEARALSYKISELLRELDEREWELGSDEGSCTTFPLDLLRANSSPAVRHFQPDAGYR